MIVLEDSENCPEGKERPRKLAFITVSNTDSTKHAQKNTKVAQAQLR